MKLALLISTFILSTAWAYESKVDVVYDRINNTDLMMDIYRPSQAPQKKMPVLVFIHGGCFNMGSRKDIPNEIKAMADEGMVVASIGYRLATVAKYPAAVTDVQQAIRYLRKNADALSIDKNKIAAHGESAGGYLAAVLGLRDITDRAKKNDEYSGRVQIVSDWFGRTDFTQKQTTGTDCAEVFLGLSRTAATMNAFQEASLAKDVDDKSSAFFILHGSNDQQVYPIHSTLLANQLWRKGKSAQLAFYENEGHGFTNRTAPWKLTKNTILSTLGLPVKTGLNSELIYDVNFRIEAGGLPHGNFDLRLNFGQGPSVPLMSAISASDFDSKLNKEGKFTVISKSRTISLSSQNFSDANDRNLMKASFTSRRSP